MARFRQGGLPRSCAARKDKGRVRAIPEAALERVIALARRTGPGRTRLIDIVELVAGGQ